MEQGADTTVWCAISDQIQKTVPSGSFVFGIYNLNDLDGIIR